MSNCAFSEATVHCVLLGVFYVNLPQYFTVLILDLMVRDIQSVFSKTVGNDHILNVIIS